MTHHESAGQTPFSGGSSGKMVGSKTARNLSAKQTRAYDHSPAKDK